MVWKRISLTMVLLALISGCTATVTCQLEVDRPLAVTIDGDGSDS